MIRIQKWLDRFQKTRVKPSCRKVSQLSYVSLEERALLATFTATDAADNVVINFENGRPATIEINGDLFTNPDETLHLDMGPDSYAQSSLASEQLTFLGDDFNISISVGSGTVNGVVTFEYAFLIDFATGDGDDVIEEDGSFTLPIIDSGYFPTSFNTGGGNDQFISNGGFLAVSLGDGDDRFIVESQKASKWPFAGWIGGGAGLDVFESRITDELFEISMVNYSNSIPFPDPTPTLRPYYPNNPTIYPYTSTARSFEKIVAPDPLEHDNLTSSFRMHKSSRIVVEGSNAKASFNDFEQSFEIENFNLFGGSLFQVIETDYAMTFDRSQNVVMGGDFGNGDTSGIKHAIHVTGVKNLVVSNSSSTIGQNVFVAGIEGENIAAGSDRIVGITGAPIYVSNTDNVTLAGSNTAADGFYVTRLDAHLVLFGNGGDDRFIIGHNERGANRDLSVAGRAVSVVGGEGNDYLRADDRDSDVARRYRVRDHWIYSTGDSPNRQFFGIWNGGTEQVDLKMNQLADKVLMSPSLETRFSITGGKPGVGFENVFLLVPPYPEQRLLIDLGGDAYAWYFGVDGNSVGYHKLIYIRYA